MHEGDSRRQGQGDRDRAREQRLKGVHPWNRARLLPWLVLLCAGSFVGVALSQMRKPLSSFLEMGAVAAILVLILWVIPKWQVAFLKELGPGEVFSYENEARKTMAQILGGVLLLMGLYFTWRTVRTTEESLRLSQEGQITERFTRAIEQLGKSDQPRGESNLAVRLGGIYALERIARDDPNDHWAVMEILTAYVRQNAAWALEKEKQAQAPATIPPDIQAILTVIGRRTLTYRNGEDKRLNLSATDIRGVLLDGANLGGADLTAAHLGGASLKGAYLQDSNLLAAALQGAFLNGAQLQRANLRGAYLEEADLTDADLTGVDLRGADLRNARGLTQSQLGRAVTDGNTLIK